MAFPLLVSRSGHYLTDSRGAPFPLLGRASWMVLSLTAPEHERYLDDTRGKGFNAVEVSALNHWPDGSNAPLDGTGQAPFLRRLDGRPWSGTLNYLSIEHEAPDFTAPNEAYWENLDRFLKSCAQRGIVVLLFPAYVGYAGAQEGWMQEMLANGPKRMQQYGTWVAMRYKNYSNIVWMLGGDRGTAPFPFTPLELSTEQALVSGLSTVPGQASVHRSAEWSGPLASSQPDFAAYITLDGVYGRSVSDFARRAYSAKPERPVFLLEGPYDEEGADGNGRNITATQPIRRFEWLGWLNSIEGYVAGNGYVWPFRRSIWHPRSSYTAHLDTQNTRDLALLNSLIRSVPWYDLVPDGQGSLGRLIVAGSGTVDSADYVAGAATQDGRLLIAYAGPESHAPFAVDLRKMHDHITARWLNPATGAYVPIGLLRNDRVQQFAVPGDNGTGFRDWALLLSAP